MRLVENVYFVDAQFVEEGGQKIVKNVVLLGPQSSHGYRYLGDAMKRAATAGLYEGARIFINHHTKEGPRDVMQMAGCFKNTRYEGGKIKGDAHLLPDQYGKKFWDIAQNMPESAGCSHVADGNLTTNNGEKVVDNISAVHGVDLVVQGATTKSVFEGTDDNTPGPGGSSMSKGKGNTNRKAALAAMTLEPHSGEDDEAFEARMAARQKAERAPQLSGQQQRMAEAAMNLDNATVLHETVVEHRQFIKEQESTARRPSALRAAA